MCVHTLVGFQVHVVCLVWLKVCVSYFHTMSFSVDQLLVHFLAAARKTAAAVE